MSMWIWAWMVALASIGTKNDTGTLAMVPAGMIWVAPTTSPGLPLWSLNSTRKPGSGSVTDSTTTPAPSVI